MSESFPSHPDQLLQQVHWVRGLAFHLVRDEAQADDLSQDALLAALENPPTGNSKAWFAKVLRYRKWTALRTESRRQAREQKCAPSEQLPSTSEIMERAELHRKLVDAVFELRDPYRTTVVLRYFEGWDNSKIAQHQRVLPATVRSRLKRGLDTLREQLDQTFGDRRAWCLALIPLLELRPEAAAVSAAATSTTVASAGSGVALPGIFWGGLIMSGKTLTAAAIVAVALTCGALLLTRGDDNNQDVAKTQGAPVSVSDGMGNSAGESSASGAASTPNSTTALDSATATSESEEASSTPTVAMGSLQGRVTSTEGKGLAGVVLHAVQSPKIEMELPFQIDLPVDAPPLDAEENRAETDPQGNFEISGLEPGQYSLIARSDGYRQFVKSRVEVAANESSEFNVVLAEGFRIEGVVLTPEGRPAAGAEVVAAGGDFIVGEGSMTISLSLGSGSADTGSIKTIADARGRFVLEGLGSGNQTLRASHDDWAPGRLTEVASGSSGVEIQLKEGATVLGVVVDPDGQPVAGAKIGGAALRAESTPKGVSDERGRFRLERVPAGTLFLHVQAEGYPGTYVRDVRVADGEVLTDLEIMLDSGIEVTGQVVDGAGNPVAGAQVRISSLNQFMIAAPVVTTTDEEGRYRVPGLRADTPYQGTATHQGYLSGTIEEFESETNRDLGVTTLTEGALVRGRVLDENGNPIAGAQISATEHREDMPGLDMIVGLEGLGIRTNSAHTTKTNEDGNFSLSGVKSGDYQIRATATGYAAYKSDPMQLSDGVQKELDIVMDRGGEITGRVIDPNGTPMAGIQVAAMRFMPMPSRSQTETDADGNFRLTGLDEGAYNVSAKSPGFATASVGQITPGSAPIELVFERKGAVRGVVLDVATGNAVEKFSVSCRRATNLSNLNLTSLDLSSLTNFTNTGAENHFQNESGEFRLTDLDPGSYTLSVRSDQYVTHDLPIEVIAGEEIEVEVELDRGGAISGTLVDRHGNPIANAAISPKTNTKGERSTSISFGVMVTNDGDEERTSSIEFGGPNRVRTDENGAFIVTGLAPGPVVLTVEHSDYMEKTLPEATIVRGETTELPTTTLEKGARIYGIIRDAEGNPTQRGNLLLYKLDEEGNRGRPEFVMPASEGNFSKTGLTSGTYEVEVHSWGSGSAAAIATGGGRREPDAVIELRPEQELEHDFQLPE